MEAEELLQACRLLVATVDRRLGSTRLVAAALLLRQALEGSLDRYWSDQVPGMEAASARAQLVSLPFYLSQELAVDVAYAWYRLSALCHRGTYDMSPAPEEVTHLAAIVERLNTETLR